MFIPETIGTPLSPGATRVMLLGAGELSKELAISLHRLGVEELDLETASRTLGAVVKYREDTDRVKQALDRMLTG